MLEHVGPVSCPEVTERLHCLLNQAKDMGAPSPRVGPVGIQSGPILVAWADTYEPNKIPLVRLTVLLWARRASVEFSLDLDNLEPRHAHLANSLRRLRDWVLRHMVDGEPEAFAYKHEGEEGA
jgi:hypothetical protein